MQNIYRSTATRYCNWLKVFETFTPSYACAGKTYVVRGDQRGNRFQRLRNYKINEYICDSENYLFSQFLCVNIFSNQHDFIKRKAVKCQIMKGTHHKTKLLERPSFVLKIFYGNKSCLLMLTNGSSNSEICHLKVSLELETSSLNRRVNFIATFQWTNKLDFQEFF